MSEPIDHSKNPPEDVEVQVVEEIIEEVIEEEQVEWIGQEEIMEQETTDYYNEDELLDHHQIVDYDETDGFDSFLLPVRHGIPVLSLNLPDLLSKQIAFADAGRLILCFNKKCQRQIAFHGYLYTIKEYFSDNQWNNWRCVSPHCFGEIRTTPNFEVREVHPHTETCTPDELQIRIRIAVYDARLMAEFTDTEISTLYTGIRNRAKADMPETDDLFPSFGAMKATLEDHRINKVYRKRFEMQNLRDKQRKMSMSANEVVYNENASGLIKFRRTKPFPASICADCNDQLMSNNLPSQDHLIAHYMYAHDRRMTIERFEFKDMNMFDQYIRELNTLSRFKLKRMGLADENMYYLCAHDDRISKNGVGRASRMQQQNNHCTAFIRIFDWRIASKREGSRIVIDYCLEHQPHLDVPIVPIKDEIDYYTPDVFVRDIEERRARTQKLVTEDGSQRGAKRQMEVRTYVPAGRVKPIFGSRSLAPPLAAQIAAGNSNPFVDVYEEQNSVNNRPRVKFRQSIRTAYPKPEEEQPGPSSASEINNMGPPPRVYITQKPFTRLTERQNFKDIYSFNAVCKAEDTCMALLNRLQNCQNARVGIAYRDKLNFILRRANLDPALADDSTPEDGEKSWTLQKPTRGRPRKDMMLVDYEGESVGEEQEDEEEEDMQDKHGERIVVDDDQEAPEMPSKEDEELEKPVKLPQRMVKEEPIRVSPAREPPVKKVAVEKPEESPAPSIERSETTTRSGRQRKVPARLVE